MVYFTLEAHVEAHLCYFVTSSLAFFFLINFFKHIIFVIFCGISVFLTNGKDNIVWQPRSSIFVTFKELVAKKWAYHVSPYYLHSDEHHLKISSLNGCGPSAHHILFAE